VPSIDHLLWKITARNFLGHPVERQHRLTGKYQHIRYNETGVWKDGRQQYGGSPNGR